MTKYRTMSQAANLPIQALLFKFTREVNPSYIKDKPQTQTQTCVYYVCGNFEPLFGTLERYQAIL